MSRRRAPSSTILFFVGANHTHGLRRTQSDKRKAVMMLLGDEEWCKRSDRWIADQCGVDHKLVAACRPTGESPSSKTGRDGKRRRKPKRKANGRPLRVASLPPDEGAR